MLISIPIFVEHRPAAAGRPAAFVVRPVFATEPEQRAEKLGRALGKLGDDLLKELRVSGEEPRHDGLAGWTFHPPLEERTLELRLELAGGTQRREFFLVGYPALGRMLWFTPIWPGFRFEVLPGQVLAERATAALTRHLRELERGGALEPDATFARGHGRLTVLELEIQPGNRSRKPRKDPRSSLFGEQEPTDGERELRRTGRLLSALDSGDLGQALGRETEVEELARWLAGSDRRPVVLVGPRQVGKTAILHEVVRRMRERKKERYGGGREIWLLSPQRLVSGMSVVGEWEDRVVAILDHARDRDRVLYFDDLPGLFAAGVHSASDLSVAQVLRTTLERRSVRVIGEITPEGWRALRERDRAFADLFQVVPVREPTEAGTLRILIHLARVAEEERDCAFDLEVVPTVYELFRRHAGDAAFPGKAAGFLRRLSVRFAGRRVTREDVLLEFQEVSGLRVALLDEKRMLSRAEILGELGRSVKGQDGVLAAFADVLVKLKARLQDPRRPLATLLLLGPTGVGKTQSAKALATYLFGSPERLLRFDLNEYLDPGSAARLTGTPREPEGLLSGAIRRQPFAVVLFDEIEKAAPEVFDLLLAVLDEGRLTDALGRVADFTRAVVLMTSNLGVQEARSRLGFGAAEEGDEAVYIAAAEKFFRPEFFNRLDRVVPFRSLPRAELEQIGREALAALVGRDGLRRRRGAVEVTEAAVERLVELGHDPRLGARALKRVLEREVAVPLATRLAGMPPARPMMARLDARDGRFDLRFRELRPAPRTVFWPEALAGGGPEASERMPELLAAIRAALRRMGRVLDARAPGGPIELGAMSDEQARYFAGREQWQRVERELRVLEESASPARRPPSVGRVPKPPSMKFIPRRDYAGSARLGRQRSAGSLQVNLDELKGEEGAVVDWPLLEVVRETAWLEHLLAAPREDRPLLLVLRTESGSAGDATRELARAYQECLAGLAGVSAQEWVWPDPVLDAAAAADLDVEVHADGNVSRGRDSVGGSRRVAGCWVQGVPVGPLLPESGQAILVQPAGGELGLVRGSTATAGDEAEGRRRFRELATAPDPFDEQAPILLVHLVKPGGTPYLLDYGTGLRVEQPGDLRMALLSKLPLPAEVRRVWPRREAEA